jgi:ecotin
MKKVFFLNLMVFFTSFQFIQAQMVHSKVDTSVFPAPKKGFTQFVIEVPFSSLEEDANKKIEIFVGKYQEVDTCNRHSLMGEFQTKDLQGWGYSYYEFQSKGDVMSTMMGCMDNQKVSKFISSQGLLLDYNGRMPIVLYVPEGMEVKYKIYKAEPETYQALQVLPTKK